MTTETDGLVADVVPALDQGLLVLFESITALISPDDWARHLPACGYTDESPNCRCGQFGADLIALLRSHDAAARVDERERALVIALRTFPYCSGCFDIDHPCGDAVCNARIAVRTALAQPALTEEVGRG